MTEPKRCNYHQLFNCESHYTVDRFVSWKLDFEATEDQTILLIMKKADSFNLSDQPDHGVSLSQPELEYFC